jgi:hypothetical protein
MRWWLVPPAVLALASCDEPGVHILTAQLYDPTRQCVSPSESVDVVNGPATGDNCSPQCLTITVGDATSVYVTTVCPPYPGDYAVEGEDATTGSGDPCTGAFAAYDQDGDICPPIAADAGEASPGDDSDDDGGGTVTDGGTDAAADAPAAG